MISILMPIRNEAPFIERSLGAVLQQTYPAERIEVLIADGMSDDDTVDIIRRMPGGERVTIVPNPGRIQAAGLNRLIPLAKGDILIRVDGHAIIEPDYVAACVETLRATGASSVGGAMDPVGTTPIGRAIAAAGKSPFAVPTAFHVSQQPQVTDTVYMGAWPRAVFEQVGGYNERVGVNEDYELNHRIRKAGGTIYFSPAIRSKYYGRQTLRALARQYYRYGRSKVRTLRLHPESLKPRQLAAPLLIAALVVGLLLVILIPALTLLWLLPIGAYIAANLLASALTARRFGWDRLPLLPVVFATIHLAWGAGFWVGIVRPDDTI
jgi:glycosyltransferase involved in cell wall biosynthesis